MGSSGRGRKRKPSQAQLEKLAQIVNPHQRAALLEAIEHLGAIPEYAWTPIPASVNLEAMEPFEVVLIVTQFVEKALAEIQGCADRARLTATRASSYLCDPFDSGLLGVMYSSSHVSPLFASLAGWGIFNPFGPTTTTLTTVPINQGEDKLLCLQIQNPFHQSTEVYGLLPKEISEESHEFRSILRILFDRNGSESFPILGLPTHIVEIPGSPVDNELLKDLFFRAIQHLGQDLDETIDGFLKYPDPWQRTFLEVRAGLEQARPFLQEMQRIRGEEANPKARLRELLDTYDAEVETGSVQVGREQFERWWKVVTDQRHVEAETSQMDQAWNGALRFQRRGQH